MAELRNGLLDRFHGHRFAARAQARRSAHLRQAHRGTESVKLVCLPLSFISLTSWCFAPRVSARCETTKAFRGAYLRVRRCALSEENPGGRGRHPNN